MNILTYLQEQGILLNEEQLAAVGAFQQELDSLYAEKAEQQLSAAVEGELQRLGLKKQELLFRLLDWQQLSLKDGEVEGLQEQLSALKAQPDCAFLFDKGGRAPRFVPMGKGSADQRDGAARGVMGLR